MSMIKLSNAERAALALRARGRAGRTDARRARLILLLDAGETHEQIRRKLACSSAFIYRWRKRFAAEGLAGLFGCHAGGKKPRKARRFERLMTDDAPKSVKRAADIIGLYLAPAQHAAIFCVDEKTAFPPRMGSVLMPAPADRHGLPTSHPGLLSLYAFDNILTTGVLGIPAVRQTPIDFMAFLTQFLSDQPRGRELHVLADHLAAQKILRIQDLPPIPCNVHLHSTQTSSSWLSHLSLWFSEIERAMNLGDVLPPPPDLTRTLMRRIRRYSELVTMTWKYVDPHRASKVTLH